MEHLAVGILILDLTINFFGLIDICLIDVKSIDTLKTMLENCIHVPANTTANIKGIASLLDVLAVDVFLNLDTLDIDGLTAFGNTFN